MKLKKWNVKEHEYEDYNVPDDWNVKTFSNDMDEIVNCCQCGKKMRYGEGYTSLEVHTPTCGFGYCTCDSCYEEEWKRRREELNLNELVYYPLLKRILEAIFG